MNITLNKIFQALKLHEKIIITLTRNTLLSMWNEEEFHPAMKKILTDSLHCKIKSDESDSSFQEWLFGKSKIKNHQYGLFFDLVRQFFIKYQRQLTPKQQEILRSGIGETVNSEDTEQELFSHTLAAWFGIRRRMTTIERLDRLKREIDRPDLVPFLHENFIRSNDPVFYEVEQVRDILLRLQVFTNEGMTYQQMAEELGFQAGEREVSAFIRKAEKFVRIAQVVYVDIKFHRNLSNFNEQGIETIQNHILSSLIDRESKGIWRGNKEFVLHSLYIEDKGIHFFVVDLDRIDTQEDKFIFGYEGLHIVYVPDNKEKTLIRFTITEQESKLLQLFEGQILDLTRLLNSEYDRAEINDPELFTKHLAGIQKLYPSSTGLQEFRFDRGRGSMVS